MTESTAAEQVARYVVSVTADDRARVAVDLTDTEADLIRRIADALNTTGGDYSGSLYIRKGGGADPDCPFCAGSGMEPFDDGGTCDCVPTATVERQTGDPS